VTVGDKGCDINPASGDLVTLSAGTGGGVKGPGVVSYGIGVKSGGSNGTPCSQVSGPEVLTVASGNGRSWDSVSLDLELKGNAWVKITLVGTVDGAATSESYHLVTGSSIALVDPPPADGNGFPYSVTSSTPDDPETVAYEGIVQCANPSDSGPDSGPNDNCYWTIQPGSGLLFSEVEITTLVGSVSLEGGADFTGTPAAGARDSVFSYVNTPPVAKGTPLEAVEDTSLTITADDLATDADGDTLTIDSASATHGEFSDGVYEPQENYCGIDTLTFTVSDGNGGTLSSSVDIDVACVNDPPVALGDSADTNDVDFDGNPVPVDIHVLSNDTDVEGDSLTVGSVDQTGTLGTVVNNGANVTYSPASGYPWDDDEFSYEDTFQYTAFDGEDESNYATVTVTVYRVICTDDEVPFSSPHGTVNGSITKITGDGELVCKRFEIVASDANGDDPATLSFKPVGDGNQNVEYRVFVDFPASEGPSQTTSTVPFGLEYDPDDNGTYQPLLMCITPEFDANGNVVVGTTELQDAETWCIASFSGVATTGGDFQVTWQLYGEGDPRFRTG